MNAAQPQPPRAADAAAGGGVATGGAAAENGGAEGATAGWCMCGGSCCCDGYDGCGAGEGLYAPGAGCWDQAIGLAEHVGTCAWGGGVGVEGTNAVGAIAPGGVGCCAGAA